MIGALATIVVGVDTTVLNVALPTLAADLHATSSQLQWIADAYLLVLAASLLPIGFLSDRFGKRTVMMAALMIFGLGSLACALAGSPGQLIAARAVLGLGAAGIMPVMFALLVVLFGPEERARAISVVGGASVLGFPLGPILGGYLIQHASWHWVFLINVPISAVALAGVALTFPAGRSATERVDWLGLLLSSVGLLALCFGFIEAPHRGWGKPEIWGSLVAAGLLVTLFLGWEHRLGHRALMDLSLWRNRAFRWGAAAAALGNLLGFAGMFFLPQFLQLILGFDPVGTGLRSLPMVMGMIVGMFVGLGLATRLGARWGLSFGLIVFVAAVVLAARTGVDAGYGAVALWSSLFGIGFGALVMTGQNAALERLPKETAGAGGGVIQVVRQVGGIVGIALLPSVFSDAYRSHVAVGGLPPALAEAVRNSPHAGVAVASKLHNTGLLASVREAFVAAGATEFWLAAAIAVVIGGAVTILMPNLRINRSAEQ